jgi:beta-glucanase (GH16 family)
MTDYRFLYDIVLRKPSDGLSCTRRARPQHAFLSAALLIAGLAAASLSVPDTAFAADAPEQLTLDQPTGTPTAQCKPIDPGDGAMTSLKLTQSFVDNFDASTLSQDTWQTHYPGSDNWVDNRTIASNHEQQIYVDPEFKGAGIDPFALKDGILSITARKTPPENLPAFKGLRYTSGLITTVGSFYQTYGYFEIKARLPRGHAYWPAFWMLKKKQSWPPEIDILETGGDTPESIDMTTHWRKEGLGPHMSTHCTVKVPESDKGFHLYGVLWMEDRIVYYIDHKPVGQFTTPPGLDHPMYLLANLAVQHSANDSTPTPMTYDIDWIAAYKF